MTCPICRHDDRCPAGQFLRRVADRLLHRPGRGAQELDLPRPPDAAPEGLGTEPRTIPIDSVDFAESIAADIARVSPGVAHRVIRMGDLLA